MSSIMQGPFKPGGSGRRSEVIVSRQPVSENPTMPDQLHSHGPNGAGADIDAVETSEWLEALDAVVDHDGPSRARELLVRVVERAQHKGTGPIATLNTPYVNT